MSKIAFKSNASGTGTLTFEAPNTNTDRTISIPDEAGTVLTTATLGVPVNGPVFTANLTANQTISHNTVTKIQFNNEIVDTNNCYDPTTNYRFTPTAAGYYQVNLIASYTVTTGRQYYYQPSIFKNGSNVISTEVGSLSNPGGRETVSINTILYMNGSSDYIEFYTYNFDYTAAASVILKSNSSASSVLVRSA